MRWSRLVLASVALGVVVSACGGQASPEERFCELIQVEIVELGDPLAASSSDEMREMVASVEELFDEWASLAPAEIASEVRVVADGFGLQKAVYDDADYEPSRVDMGALTVAIMEIVTGEFSESNQVVTRWLVDHCL